MLWRLALVETQVALVSAVCWATELLAEENIVSLEAAA